MDFEWDEAKRVANLDKYGIDFVRAVTIWKGEVIDPAAERRVDDEIRILAIGTIGEGEIVIAVVDTVRADVRRLISARRGRRNEQAYYQSQFGRGA